ncbi:MAG: hypothetical protein Ct9H300mP21_08230 [Pseudomonadota bacterium]|nr:MAG: hypothetical protein Ct9H300mP21_08230 [Pseudomonadota bacterium]
MFLIIVWIGTWKHGQTQTALIWESDDPNVDRTFTYKELHERWKFANVIKNRGIKKGDRVMIYMPMIPELQKLSGLY